MKTAKEINKHDFDSSVVKRILSNCLSINDCLVWRGAKTRVNNGYGRIFYKGKQVCTHRVIYAFKKGRIPKGKIICHSCDNSLCCNSDHMFIGTQKDNMMDMNKKGRGRTNPLKGQKNPNAKITDKDAFFIINNYKPYCKIYGATPLAEKFNISIATVYRIAVGQRWKHIQ